MRSLVVSALVPILLLALFAWAGAVKSETANAVPHFHNLRFLKPFLYIWLIAALLIPAYLAITKKLPQQWVKWTDFLAGVAVAIPFTVMALEPLMMLAGFGIIFLFPGLIALGIVFIGLPVLFGVGIAILRRSKKRNGAFVGGLLIAPAVFLAFLFISHWTWQKYFSPKPPLPTEVSAETFSFEQFGSGGKAESRLRQSLKLIFPVGTPKADVDKILINRAGAEIFNKNIKYKSWPDYTFYTYVHDAPYFLPIECMVRTWGVDIGYDKDMQVQQIEMVGVPCAKDKRDSEFKRRGSSTGN